MKELNMAGSDGSLEAQLVALYRGQKLLLSELGTCEPTEIVAMVKGLQEQLIAIYAERTDAETQLPVFSPEGAP